MNFTRRGLAIAMLIPFAILTFYALAQVGYIGLIEFQLRSPAGWQVLADLVVSLVLVLSWIVPDAKRAGRQSWPWVVATVFTGSIAPLIYLAIYGTQQHSLKRPANT